MMKTDNAFILTNEMKQLFYYIIAFLVIANIACLDDKDSLTTRDFDHVLAIDGLQPEKGTEFILYIGDTLKLEPQIIYSAGSKPEDYTYRWIIGKDTVSKELNLEWQITRPRGYQNQTTVPGVLIVQNRTNKLEFRQMFTMEINSNLTPKYIAVYETGEHTIDWVSIQGDPTNFTRFFAGMNSLINGSEEAIEGNFRGSLICKSELVIFTDQTPDYGYSVSLLKENDGADFTTPLGGIIAPVRGRVYQGTATTPDFRSVRYCEGGTRFLLMNDKLYTFNGGDKKTPMFDDQTYLKANHVAQVIASKQFMRYKKITLIRYDDNTISCFYEYDEAPVPILLDDDTNFKLDTIYGMFTESTGLASKKPYKMYVIGKEGAATNLYELAITYSGKFLPPQLNKTIPLPQPTVEATQTWFGAFSQRYGFQVTSREIYKFDYLNITGFYPEPTPFKSFPDNYEITEIFPIIKGSGLKDADDYTVVYLYDKIKNTTTIHVYETLTGKIIREYPDVIPGRGKDFIKC